MLLGEPPPTQGDLRLSILGIPVRVHPFFWVIGALLGPWESGRGMPSPVVLMLMWMVALLISILLHELGHAFAMRAYGGRPWITLYGLGGLTSSQRIHSGSSRSSTLSQVLISLAGPGTGFLFAALVTGLIVVTGHPVEIERGLPFLVRIIPGRVGSIAFTYFLYQLLFINVIWGVVNLLPVYPLDGGHVARELLVAVNPREGVRQSLQLSIFTGVLLAVFGLLHMRIFIAFLFGYLAYTSYATLQAYTRRGPW